MSKLIAESKWSAQITEWKKVQQELSSRVIQTPLSPLPRLVAGVDCAFSKDEKKIFAAAVVYDRVDRKVIEVAHATAVLDVPYIPGYLSFREGPAVIAAIKSLKSSFSVICFDGQGLAHPRRCGLATHVGVMLDLPSIGCAKSRFIGTHTDPAAKAGSIAKLMDGPEQIGVVLRTRDRVAPIYVSIGHRVDLPSAVELLMSCVKSRIPEPTRNADREVAVAKSSAL